MIINNSSNINSVEYELDAKILTVEFKSKVKYEYHDVPPTHYMEIMDMNDKQTGSVGKYINDNIVKGTYKFNQVLTKKSLEDTIKKIIKDSPIIGAPIDADFSDGVSLVLNTLIEKFNLTIE